MIRTILALIFLIALVMVAIWFIYTIYRVVRRENQKDVQFVEEKIDELKDEYNKLDDLHFEVKREIKRRDNM